MKVKLLKQTIIAGKTVKRGEEIDLSVKEANLLIGMKKAVKVSKEEEPLTLSIQVDENLNRVLEAKELELQDLIHENEALKKEIERLTSLIPKAKLEKLNKEKEA